MNERTAVVAFFVVALIAVLGAVRLQLNRPGESEVALNRYWVQKVTAPAVYDVVVVGDSRVYRGFDPFSAETILDGTRVLNYGFSFIGYNPSLLSAASEKLDVNSGQQIIILGITPHSLTPNGAKSTHFFQETQRSIDYKLQYQYVPDIVLRFVEPFPQSAVIDRVFGQESNTYYQQFYANGWAASSYETPEPDKFIYYAPGWFWQNQVSAGIVRMVIDQVAVWQASGIQVFAYRPPASDKLATMETDLSGFDEDSFVAQFEAAGGQWIAVDANSTYSFYDGSHLERDSAEKLTRQIAQFIQAHAVGNAARQ